MCAARSDSLRLRAALLDLIGGRQIAEVEVSDTLSIDRVANSLAVALLTGLGRTRPVGAVEMAVECYQRVVDLWRRADPALPSYVSQARDGLARLTGEP